MAVEGGQTAGVSKERKYIGVRKRPSGKYSAKISLKKTTTWLGTFTSARVAARAYDAAAIKFRGPNAITNFPQVAVNEVKTEVNLPSRESIVLVLDDDDQDESQNVIASIDQVAVNEVNTEVNLPLRESIVLVLDDDDQAESQNVLASVDQAGVSEERTEVDLPSDPNYVDSIVLPLDHDDRADSETLFANVEQPLRKKSPPKDYQNAVEMDGAESSSQSHHKSMKCESGYGVPIPDMAPVEYCRQLMQSNAYIPDNLQRVLVRLFDSHPETFTTKCTRMDSSLLAFRLLGVAGLVAEIVNTDSSSLEMSTINGHLNSLEDMQKDGFNLSWFIKRLKYIRDPYMTTYCAQFKKNMEDLKIKEARLKELAPKIKESAQAFAQAKRTHEDNLMEKAEVESSISAISHYQREISSDVAASIGEDFFTTRNLLFLLD